jgi:peptide chain release factor 1
MIDTTVTKYELNRSEVDKKFIRSSGNGGQRVNKVATCCQLTHVPTGIQVKCQDSREQSKNEEIAWQRLEDKLSKTFIENQIKKIDDKRYSQIGNGSRSDKRRTYRVDDDTVIDHVTDKKCRFRDILKGRIELLS